MNYCFEGDLYSENVFEIKEEIKERLDQGSGIVLDFKNVNYIDSTGLGLLVSIHKKAVIDKKDLKLINVNEEIERIFNMTMLDTLLSIND